MEFLGENGLQKLIELIKSETDKKVNNSVLSAGKSGQFAISDGKGGITFITVPSAEGSKF